MRSASDCRSSISARAASRSAATSCASTCVMRFLRLADSPKQPQHALARRFQRALLFRQPQLSILALGRFRRQLLPRFRTLPLEGFPLRSLALQIRSSLLLLLLECLPFLFARLQAPVDLLNLLDSDIRSAPALVLSSRCKPASSSRARVNSCSVAYDASSTAVCPASRSAIAACALCSSADARFSSIATLAVSRSSIAAFAARTCRKYLVASAFSSPYRLVFAACRFSEFTCRVTSSRMSKTLARFCLALSSFASARRFRVLNFVTPAASSITFLRSCGRLLRICPIRPCSIIA